MTVIFNEEQAKEKRRKIDEKIREEREWKETLSIMKKVSSSLIISFALVGLLFLHFEVTTWTLIFATIILSATFIPVVIKVLIGDAENSAIVSTKYSPDIEYMSATRGKKVCDYNFVFHEEDDTAEFYIITESETGEMGEKKIGNYFEQIYTDKIKEITIDLEESVMYIPKMSA